MNRIFFWKKPGRELLLFDKVIAFLFALRAVSFVWLAFASEEYNVPYATFILILRYTTIPLGFIYVIRQKNIDYKNILLLAPLLFYFIMLIVNTYGGYHGSYIHELVSISVFLLMKKNEKSLTFKYFYYIVLVSCAISIALYLLYIVGQRGIFKTVLFYNDGKPSSYYKQFLVFAIMDSGFSFPRLCGLFNEPGALGTVCALLFAATYSKSSRLQKAILLLSILFSLSVAGIVLVVLYFGALMLVQKKWELIFIVAVLGAFFLTLPYIDFGNSALNSFFARFRLNGIKLDGDNRTNALFDNAYNAFLNSPEIIFGKGATYGDNFGSSSYKSLIMQFGFLGIGIYFVFWVAAFVRNAKMNEFRLLLLFIFVVSLYQRPVTLVNSYGYVVMFGSFAWSISKASNTRANIIYVDRLAGFYERSIG